ncbi:hypothetical protein NCAS_0C02540 [Naumovozyma castellii]|uniref:ERCC4 domain-containing protein n=1 Tax=Naumovozyma castellii TaxID=27288 RepID=G0VCN4_NAUCA|nr:hypothetical protein NCAS_0C02540 [Naumovozyma castellii CBS 4309]CCC69244.1 hypothetical protein NCAS_0C02540 [Naumovozyma castellii CBS 4309]
MSQLFVQEDSEDEELQLELSRQVEADEERIKDLQQKNTSSNDEIQRKQEEEEEAPLYPLIPNIPEDGQDFKPNLDDIRAVSIQLNLPLLFQQQVVESALITDDPLVIMGKGLGMASIVANLLQILATPTKLNDQLKRSLVLVLNARPRDNQRIQEELQELSWLSMENEGDDNGDATNEEYIIDEESPYNRPFSVISADSLSVENRRKLYLSGGIICVTSRILIVDLLSGILHPSRVTGMVVLNVEDLRNHSNVSFILEIYRSKNKWGFIKAFSESPESFTLEFSPLLSKMRDLRLRNVLLWPRFRVEVSACLNKLPNTVSNSVIEVKVSLTNSMSQIQFGLMECLKKCIAELNRKNPELFLEWWNIDNALDINFLKSIDSVMIPNWHRISYESKQLTKDIRYLKNLLKLLINADAVDFYEEIQLSLEANKPSISRKYSESPWLMANESQLVISYAKKRIINDGDYFLEEMPKWEQLISILDDIAHERLTKDSQGTTLIACSDSATCAQLTRVLACSDRKNGLRRIMLRKLQHYKALRDQRRKIIKEVRSKGPAVSNPNELNVSAAFAKEEIITKRRRTRGAAAVAAVERLRTAGTGDDIESKIDSYDIKEELTHIGDDDSLKSDSILNKFVDDDIGVPDIEADLPEDDDDDSAAEELYLKTAHTGVTKELWEARVKNFEYISRNEQIIVEKFSNLNDDSTFEEIMPSYIIMFEPDLSVIRRVEVYRAIHRELAPKVYFMYYGESVEEQSHLTAIKKEKDAFTKLIREHANLAQHFETTEDLSHFKNLAERKSKLNKLKRSGTRNAGGQAGLQEVTQDIIVVDTREFNAPLPGLLFRYGVRVLPCMLTVGDYIITPDICIERKSISDLIGSLQNNRLVSQCKKMLRYYKYPTLLIEFDEGQSFSLEPFSEKRHFKNKESSTTHPISNKLTQEEIQNKLSKLVMKFPTLKIIWSSSPLQTVNILLELKLGREQPDPSVAIQYGTGSKKTQTSKKKISNETNNNKFAKILDIPGISKIDYFNIRKRFRNFEKLQKLPLQEINNVLDDETLSTKLYSFFQAELMEREKDGATDSAEEVDPVDADGLEDEDLDLDELL